MRYSGIQQIHLIYSRYSWQLDIVIVRYKRDIDIVGTVGYSGI